MYVLFPSYLTSTEGLHKRYGIFIFTLNNPQHILRSTDIEMEPLKRFVSVKALTHFTHSGALQATSWTALSADSFWTTWHPIVWQGAFSKSLMMLRGWCNDLYLSVNFDPPTLVRVKMV